MKIVFLKDHVNYKAGDVVENHPNEGYLIRCNVAKAVVVSSPKTVVKNGKL